MLRRTDGEPLCFDLSGFIRSDPAENIDPSVQEGDVRDRDRQAFSDDPAFHIPSLGHFEKRRVGGTPEEGKRSLLPGELLHLRSGVLPGFPGKVGAGDKM